MAKTNRLLATITGRLRAIMNFAELEDRSSYTIGQLSTHLGVSLRTLRFYEQSGLLAPNRDGLRRLYSQEDRERLEVIVTLRELEVSLTAIKALMVAIDADGKTSDSEVSNQIDAILTDLEAENRARIGELERINLRIDELRRSIAAG